MNTQKKDVASIRMSDSLSLDESLNEMFSVYNLEAKYHQALLLSKWEKIVGATVATRTEKISFKNQIMYVTLTSAALKHQLNLSKSKLISLINDEINKIIILDIVFL